MPRQATTTSARGFDVGAINMQPDSEWQRRYDAAHNELEDARLLAQYQRLVNRCDPAAPPSAHIFARPKLTRRARRVCLLAGSFNPLTVAHVALAEAARKMAQLDLIIWVFTAITIDKEHTVRASHPDRLAQLNAYMGNMASSEGNLLALLNRGLYVDQASAIRPLLGASAELYMLVGFDKIVQIFDSRYYVDREAALLALFAQTKLLVAPRAGAGKAELDSLLATPQNALYANHIEFIPVPPEYAEDSSTEARAAAARNDAMDSEALHQLVAPEGIALVGTGAYASMTATTDIPSPSQDDTSDVYLWRQTWIQALARTRLPELTHEIPPLSVLLTHTTARDAHGAEIRRMVTHAVTAPPKNVSQLLRAAIASMW